jgi:hypothetical protein
MKVVDIARTIAPSTAMLIIRIRPGGEFHEQVIGEEDPPYTSKYNDHYKTFPAIHNWCQAARVKGSAPVVGTDFT